MTAGADLKELAQISTAEAFTRGWLKDVEDAFASFRKPIIAAVRGFAVSCRPLLEEASSEVTEYISLAAASKLPSW